MNEWAWVIVIVSFGIIVGNLLLLKDSAKMKFPKPSKDNNKNWDDEDDQD